jgi:hypothetical protein
MSSYWAAMAYDGAPGSGRPQAPQAVSWSPWTNTPDGRNLMIFDTAADAGTRMADFHLSMGEIRSALQNETGFRTRADHCRVYGDIFGADEFYRQNCSGL